MKKFKMSEMKPAVGKNAGGQMVVLKNGKASIATPLKPAEAAQIGPAGFLSLAVVKVGAH